MAAVSQPVKTELGADDEDLSKLNIQHIIEHCALYGFI